MRILHVTPSFFPARRYGGPIQTVLQLCVALQRAGLDVSVATTAADGPHELDVPTDRWVEVRGLPVRYFARTVPLDYAPSLGLAEYLLDRAADFDLVHVTSTFSFPSTIAGYAARTRRVPYVVSPHGSLQSWSLRQKRWKKIPYWLAIERRHLLQAAGIHVTANIERDELATVLAHPDIFIVPNGQEWVEPPAVAREPHRVVFLGRIHPKKGFDVLVPAMARVTREIPSVELVVAGPDEGHWHHVEQLITRATPRPTVRYVGAVYGDERYRLLASAAVFALTSHSENFGMSVVEAMACGTPVVVSRNCPWAEVERQQAGYWIENTPEEAARAILDVLRHPGMAVTMGNAGRRLAEAFRWEAVGPRMADEYCRIIGSARRTHRGDMPGPRGNARGVSP